jgi:hypothetical protein
MVCLVFHHVGVEVKSNISIEKKVCMRCSASVSNSTSMENRWSFACKMANKIESSKEHSAVILDNGSSTQNNTTMQSMKRVAQFFLALNAERNHLFLGCLAFC